MRANEIKESSLLGALGSQFYDTLRRSPQSQLSIKDRMIQRQFIDDLVGRASINLAQGIQGGLIDPNAKSATTPQAQAGTQPPAGQSTQGPATQPQAQQTPAKDELGRMEPQPQVKPQTGQALKSPTNLKYNVPNVKATQQQQQPQYGKTTYNVPTGLSQPAVTKPVVVQPQKLNPAQIRQQKQAQAAKTSQSQMASFRHDQDDYPNIVRGYNESVIDEAQYSYTISSYLKTFLKQYMGDNLDTRPLDPMCDEVEATYSKDAGKNALRKLASSAFALYWTSPTGVAARTGTTTGQSINNLQAEVEKALDTKIEKPATDKKGVPGEWAQAKELLANMGPNNKARLFNLLRTEQLPKMSRRNKKILYDLLKPEFEKNKPEEKPNSVDNVNDKGEKLKAKRKAPAKKTTAKKSVAKNEIAESKSYKVWGQK